MAIGADASSVAAKSMSHAKQLLPIGALQPRQRRSVALARPGLLVVTTILFAQVAGCGGGAGDAKREGHRRAAEEIEVRVVGVHDGDTLTGLTSGREQIKVRIEGIDAPELGQPFGRAAKRVLSEKVFDKKVTVHTTHKDLYGRVVGRVSVGGRDVGPLMVREGYAWHATHFSHDKTHAPPQVQARRARAGLWADASPQPPWEFRKQRKGKTEKPAPQTPSRWFWWWQGP